MTGIKLSSLIIFLTLTTVQSLVSASSEASESNWTSDHNLSRISNSLGRKTIVCDAYESKDNSKKLDLFPVSIQMYLDSNNRTKIEIKTTASTFAGSGEYLIAEASSNFLILKDGDDGYNVIFLNLMDEDSLLDNPTGLFSFQRGGGDSRFENTVSISCKTN